MKTLLLCLFLAINHHSGVDIQQTPQQRPPEEPSRAEIEKINRRIIRAEASKSLNDSDGSASGKVKLSIRLGSNKYIFSLSFSPNGRQVLAAQDVTAVLYNLEDGVELRRLRHLGIVTSADFSPDGRLLVTGSVDKTARLWDVRTGREVRRFEGHPDSVTSVGFSPDGRWVLTGCADQIARLWNTATGTLVKRFADEEEILARQKEQEKGQKEEEEEGKEEEGYEEVFATLYTYKAFSAVFSNHGRQIVTGDAGQKVRMWDVESGALVKELDENIGFEWGVHRVVASPDGRRLLTHSDSGVQMWDIESGEEIEIFKEKSEKEGEGEEGEPIIAVFSPDGRFILAGYRSNKVKLLDIKTGKVIKEYKSPSGAANPTNNAARPNDGKKESHVVSVAFSGDGRMLAAGSNDGVSRIWETSTGKFRSSLEGNLISVRAIDVSNDGRHVLVGGDGVTGLLWDLRRGSLVRQLKGHSDAINSVTFSPDGALALTTSEDYTARLWKVSDGSTLKTFEASVTSAAFSSDGKLVFTGHFIQGPALWDSQTGAKLKSFDPTGANYNALSIISSPDGKFALTGQDSETAVLWDMTAGKELMKFGGHRDRKREEKVRSLSRFEIPNSVLSVAFSPDGNSALSGSRDNTARIWDLRTGNELQQFAGHAGDVNSARFSPDGRNVLTASSDFTAVLWDIKTGKVERCFAGHRAAVTTAVFLSEGKYILTGSDDGTVRLWETATGKELCSLISFRDGAWVVVAPDGRFDTNNLEGIRGLNWIAPDEPFHPLPLEIFVRDYYEPRLLARLLDGEQLPPVRDLSALNRVQPNVSIIGMRAEPNRHGTVSVTVEVAAADGEFQRDGQNVALNSGAYDLRLFREGQLVGQFPQGSSSSARYEQADQEARIKAWRAAGEIKLRPQTGKVRLTFRNIRLPRGAVVKQVRFTAYAFNEDRVRSEIARETYNLTTNLPAAKGRAYIITMGVNASENPGWDLRFAVSDAELIQRTLTRTLNQSREFGEVVPITLVSRFEGDEGARKVNRRDLATKANLKAVLDLLAGKNVKAKILSGITNAEKVRPARPEDLVLIAVSSHGVATKGGFYLVPYDIGHQGEPETERCISSEELSQWLWGVDAGEMAMIVDACQSRASFEAGGYKPGPMGDRGLGQLAYDKGIRILAASQDAALESEKIGQGLLTYSLVHDGLMSRQADHDPKDGAAYLSEWLGFGVERVPQLFDEIVAGKVRAVPRSTRGSEPVPIAGETFKREAAKQQPSLFDFTKKPQAVRLFGGRSQ